MDRVRTLLNELMEELELKEGVKLKIVPMKQKLASLSLRTKILRLNQDAVEKLDDEELRYILLHELIHLKIGDINHGSLFLRELEKAYRVDESVNLEIKIIEKLISEQILDIPEVINTDDRGSAEIFD